MSSQINDLYSFGEFRFDAGRRILWRKGEMVSLPPRATDVLLVLLESRGGLIERDELLGKVWGDTFVEEGNLNHTVSVLRRTLGDSGLIQTIPRRGYRFAGNVNVDVIDGRQGVLVEKRTLSHTTIEESDSSMADTAVIGGLPAMGRGARLAVPAALTVILVGIASVVYVFNNAIAPKPGDRPKVLAVLPLRPANAAEDLEGLGYGIAENLAARLAVLDELVVRPVSDQASSDAVEFGKNANASVVLSGSFQRSGGRIRMTVNLTDVGRGGQIWSGNFDEREDEIFKLQDALCAQAAEQLIKRLTPQQKQQLAVNPTDNVEAYKLFIKGRYLWNKRTKETIEESIADLRASIDLDPTFALAYAGLADSYVILNDYDAAPPNETYPKAKAAAIKALELDPDLVQPRITLAYILAVYDWEYGSAEAEYREAIKRNPNYATAHQWYGEMLCATKRFAEAEVELRRAAEIDPLVPIIQSEIAVNLYYSRRFDEAIAHYSKLKKEHPAFPTSYLFSAWAYEQQGETELAFDEEIQFWTLQNLGDAVIEDLRIAFRTGGRTAFLERLARALESSAGGRYFHEYRIIHVYGRLKDREKVLEWLREGVRNHSSNVVKVFIDPNFDFLRGDPQFQQLLNEMKLPS